MPGPMMRCELMTTKTIVCLLMLFSGTVAFSQVQRDTAFFATAKQNALAEYEKALGTQKRLYNGSKYQPPEHELEEHPYFILPDWLNGSVYYDGEYFTDVPLMYDLYNQMLITEHGASGHAMRLVEEKVKHFTIDGHYFERIVKDSVKNSLPETGFYEVLYNGPTQVLARREEWLREQIVNTQIETLYNEKNRYFILHNGVFFPVNRKASAMKLLADRKSELKRFLRKNHLSFSVNKELALKSMAEHYDQVK